MLQLLCYFTPIKQKAHIKVTRNDEEIQRCITKYRLQKIQTKILNTLTVSRGCPTITLDAPVTNK